ncbi:MAG TPA: hypothetical protein DFR83_25405, partial [Deltaproteobacteria bacterium]|nr:hypothetical protein [Deltaproteobacteria bacterium]
MSWFWSVDRTSAVMILVTFVGAGACLSGGGGAGKDTGDVDDASRGSSDGGNDSGSLGEGEGEGE